LTFSFHDTKKVLKFSSQISDPAFTPVCSYWPPPVEYYKDFPLILTAIWYFMAWIKDFGADLDLSPEPGSILILPQRVVFSRMKFLNFKF